MKKITNLLVFFVSFLVASCFNIHTKTRTPEVSLVKHLNNSTVILWRGSGNEYNTLCTGVWISDSQILTARHCVEALLTPKVILTDQGLEIKLPGIKDIPGVIVPYSNYSERNDEFNFNKKPHFAVAIAYSSMADLALLAPVSSDTNHEIAVLSSTMPEPGEKVHVIGHTVGMTYNYTVGVMSRTFETDNLGYNFTALHLSVIIGPGNSGGGAYDSDGKLLGICSQYGTRVAGIGLFVSIQDILDFLAENKN